MTGNGNENVVNKQETRQQHPARSIDNYNDQQGSTIFAISCPSLDVGHDISDTQLALQHESSLPNKPISMLARLYVMVVVSVAVFIAALVLSHYMGSLLLLTATYHMLYNTVSIVGDLVCTKVCSRQSKKNTYGWTRIKLLSLLISTLLLGSFCFAIFVEATQEIIRGSEIHPKKGDPLWIAIFGGIGLAANLLALIVIGGYTNYQQSFFAIENDVLTVKTDIIKEEAGERPSDDLPLDVTNNKMKSCEDVNANVENNEKRIKHESSGNKILALFRDTFGFFLVLISGFVQKFYSDQHFTYIEPALCYLYIIILLVSSYTIMKESGLILMQSIPAHIDVASIINGIKKQFPSIANVHDIHIWQLSRSHIVATAHVIFKSCDSYKEMCVQLSTYFRNNGISSVTIQPEFIEQCDSEERKLSECLLRCKDQDLCQSKTCCGLKELEDDNNELRRRKNISVELCNSAYVSTPTVVKKPMLISQYNNGQVVSSVDLAEPQKPTESYNGGTINVMYDDRISDPSIRAEENSVSHC